MCAEGFPSNSPPRAYLNNPTTCGEPLTAGPRRPVVRPLRRERPRPRIPPTTGCDQLGFNPSLFGRPTTTQSDTASGFDVDLTVPQSQSPDVPLPSSIRGADVTLPEGFSINANAGDGKMVCTDAAGQLRTGAISPPNAPSSRRSGRSRSRARRCRVRFPASSTSTSPSRGTATGFCSSLTASAST